MFINSKAKASRVLILALSLALIQFSYSEETETDENTEVPAEDENPETEKVPYRLCQRDLLYAYGIENPGYIKAPGMLCKHKSPESCCSRTAESQLMEKWIETDRVKLIQNIDGYYHILEGIFDYYEDIILFAKYVHLNPYSVDVCVRSVSYTHLTLPTSIQV